MENEQTNLPNGHRSDGILRLLSAAKIEEILGISAKTVHKIVRSGRLGCVKITARQRKFTMQLLKEFIRAETYYRDRIHADVRDYCKAMAFCRP